MEWSKGFVLTTFQFLYNGSTHGPVLSYSPHFCQSVSSLTRKY